MKKQIRLSIIVILSALLLFGVYAMFLRDSAVDEEADPFYVLTYDVKLRLEDIEEKVVLRLSGVAEEVISKNQDLERIYKMALEMNKANSNIQVEFAPGEEYKFFIIKGDQSIGVEYDSFYKTLEDGTKFAFDGERIIANGIFSLFSMEEMTISLRALSGFDTDGDFVSSGGQPFMYKSYERKDLRSFRIVNQQGAFRAYKAADGNFRIEGADIVELNAEKFAQLVTEVRYPLTAGKVTDALEFDVYGLENDESATAIFTVNTEDGNNYKVYIGMKTADNNYYYARCEGKDFVYLLAASSIDETIMQQAQSFMQANLVYGISQTTEAYLVDNIVIDFFNQETESRLKAVIHSTLNTSSNLHQPEGLDAKKTLTDKLNFSAAYENWTEQGALTGFTSSDGKDIYVEIPLIYTGDNNYKVEFGLARDESLYAYTPSKIYAKVCTNAEGTEFVDVEIGKIDLSSLGNKGYKKFSFKFTTDQPVHIIRLYFACEKGKYVVMDEVRIFVNQGGSYKDAHPADGITGGWRLIEGAGYIPEGNLYIYPEYSFGSNFVSSVATLMGNRVVDFGITTKQGDPEKLNMEKLAKYGLDEPAMRISFEYGGYVTQLFVSNVNEDGKYYVYSIITGKDLNLCTDIVAEISTEGTGEEGAVANAWLDWNIYNYFDNYIISMMIDTIDEVKFAWDGKEYVFTCIRDDENKLARVKYNGEDMVVDDFRRLYISVLNVYTKGDFAGETSGENQILEITVKATSATKVYRFYRISQEKAYYTIDGEGKFYVLVERVMTVQDNVNKIIAGETVGKS